MFSRRVLILLRSVTHVTGTRRLIIEKHRTVADSTVADKIQGKQALIHVRNKNIAQY